MANLKPGQLAVIKNFDNCPLALKFMEMGIVPGATVSLYSATPFGGPIAIDIMGSTISMRRNEANTIKIELI